MLINQWIPFICMSLFFMLEHAKERITLERTMEPQVRYLKHPALMQFSDQAAQGNNISFHFF